MENYKIEQYQTKSVFSNFISGISGQKGIPIWCHYVNRGQGIASFGVQDKDHSIMQFTPAHQSYQRIRQYGFRTFFRVDGKVGEAFTKDQNSHDMEIGMNDLSISEKDTDLSYEMNVTYFALPNEELGGLVRCVTIKNCDNKKRTFEVLDGMAEVLPYGIKLENITEMGQTSKAWMMTQFLQPEIPIFKLCNSLEDSVEVIEIIGGNFGLAVGKSGEKLPVIVDNQAIFAQDTTLLNPITFYEQGIAGVKNAHESYRNTVPSCMFMAEFELDANETYCFYEVYGQTSNLNLLEKLQANMENESFIKEKRELAQKLVWDITDKIGTKTGHEIFDMYCRQTYLDNIIRGGEPIQLAGDKVFYLYSRKHGDLERDYNYFSLLPEFYTQGNGNFRDVNQNRRSDNFFSPYVGDFNIKLFYNAIQLDGYNPLEIQKITFSLTEEKSVQYDDLAEYLRNPFTPGMLFSKLKERNKEELFDSIMKAANYKSNTSFKEGYWTDHWTYNLDLVESYVSIFPDEEQNLLYGDKTYTYQVPEETVLPNYKRYKETKNGVRQNAFLEKNPSENVGNLAKNDQDELFQVTLMEKLVHLAIVKFCNLDFCGMGIEMEGGKPGWYDALNGLPGLLGSSMCETYELLRMVNYILEKLEKYETEIELHSQLLQLYMDLINTIDKYFSEIKEFYLLDYWKEINVLKETYRASINNGVAQKGMTYPAKVLVAGFVKIKEILEIGIQKAIDFQGGICPSYFYYEVKDYETSQNGLDINTVSIHKMPLFLEGVVRYLKGNESTYTKELLYQKVKKSNLYDSKIEMYKVNASLKEAISEIGRAHAFEAGWLENESIWLHMEYKYFLELFNSGLYKEFIEDFEKGAIPFLDGEVYGRSLFENSSFIASSANSNESIHGKGFVARLSGSTAEFLQIWSYMMFGKTPFSMEEELTLKFTPLIPSYLIGDDLKIQATFLGEIPVKYSLDSKKDFIPGEYQVKSYEIIRRGKSMVIKEEKLSGAICYAIRSKDVEKIIVKIK